MVSSSLCFLDSFGKAVGSSSVAVLPGLPTVSGAHSGSLPAVTALHLITASTSDAYYGQVGLRTARTAVVLPSTVLGTYLVSSSVGLSLRIIPKYSTSRLSRDGTDAPFSPGSTV